MIQLKKDGLSPSPDVGGGGTLQGLFSSGKIGMAIGGGFWAGGLHNAGMKPGAFDVQFFPKWQSQRHLFGTNGYGLFKQGQEERPGLGVPQDAHHAGRRSTPSSRATAARRPASR